MRRDNYCNLELRLFPPSCSPSDDNDYNKQQQQHHHTTMEKDSSLNLSTQATANGNFLHWKLSESDDTESQVRAILMHASREMEERLKTPRGSSESSSSTISSKSVQLNKEEEDMCTTPTNISRLSMKRSLQRFLQKRRLRVQANSPYQH